ncbi:uncharacterized protein LOC116005741 [Ipomoea triloba]|uniref:uncharacterized protein LOC116005741 n=1 Tax=Ipomoea triloba TaxID=35885 RepID=UPI00125E130A|nr:uncharacterized protein LOC116005741 [Ipomoea triloba]
MSDYVPPVERELSSTPTQCTQSAVSSDEAAWYNDVEHFGQYSHYPSSTLQPGMVFATFKDLKIKVVHHNLAVHKQFKSAHKRSEYWKATCLYPAQCPWMITAAPLGNGDQWIVKKFKDKHTCRVDYSQGGADYIVTITVIADFILPKIQVDPMYKIKYVQQDVKTKWGVNVNYKKAWYARVQALQTLYGKWDESYNLLPQMLRALQQTNPGTVVDIVANPTPNPNEFEFKYAFWAFKPAIDGFKYCLPVLTIDGTHLYGKYKGHLLLAVSMNANKEIYPIAYSIVDAETGDSWTWFLKLVAQHVFGNSEHICIISDRHGGIDVAFTYLN